MNVHVASETYEGDRYRQHCFSVLFKKKKKNSRRDPLPMVKSSLVQLCVL